MIGSAIEVAVEDLHKEIKLLEYIINKDEKKLSEKLSGTENILRNCFGSGAMFSNKRMLKRLDEIYNKINQMYIEELVN